MENKEKKTQKHGFGAVVYPDSEILILGSFPSVKSREMNFYYMNPQNRFWRVLTQIYNLNFDTCSIEEKIHLLKHCKIALYDVCESCDIIGSQDVCISEVIPLNLNEIMSQSNIEQIYLNGKTAYRLFLKYFPTYKNIAHCLPSTSSANALYTIASLVDEWKIVRK